MNSVNGLIIVVIGPARVGKTTFCKEFMIELRDKNLKAVHYEFDKYIRNINLHSMENAYHNERKVLHERIFKRLLLNRLERGDHYKVALLDDTMHLRSMRYEIYKLCQRENYSFLQIILKSSLVDVVNNYRLSSNGLTFETVRKIYDTFEYPKFNNPWEQNQFWIEDQNQISYKLLFKQIESLLDVKTNIEVKIDPKILKRCREINETNFGHQCDNILRRCITKYIENNHLKKGIKVTNKVIDELVLLKSNYIKDLKDEKYDYLRELLRFSNIREKKVEFKQLIASIFHAEYVNKSPNLVKC